MYRWALASTVAALLTGGCAGNAAHLQRENQELRAKLADLRAESRRDRHTIRDLENQLLLAGDRAETAAVHRGRATADVPALPVEVLEPEAAPRPPAAGGDYEVVGVDDDGTEIVYIGEAANERSIRPSTTGLRGAAPARARPVDEDPELPSADDERVAVTRRVPSIDEQMRQVRAEAPRPSAAERSAPVAATDDPRELYRRHLETLKAGKHAEAIAGFRAFLTRFPAHDYADNAQYWLGEAFYDQKQYREAVAEFRKVVLDHPKGNKVPDSMLKIGYSYLALGYTAQARDVLHELVRVYPKTNPAALASRKLEELARK